MSGSGRLSLRSRLLVLLIAVTAAFLLIMGGVTTLVLTRRLTGQFNADLVATAARNPQTLAMAVDQRSRTLQNIRHNGRLAVEILGDDLCYGLRGTAILEKETMASAPFPCALVALKVEDCRDHGAAGVKFVGPSYSFHEGKEHRRDVEEKVFAELKGPPPTI